MHKERCMSGSEGGRQKTGGGNTASALTLDPTLHPHRVLLRLPGIDSGRLVCTRRSVIFRPCGSRNYTPTPRS